MIRKRYIRQAPRWEGNFTIIPEMVGKKLNQLRRVNPHGRGRPFGLVGYEVDGNQIRFAHSIAHHNDVFNKQIAHKTVDARLTEQTQWFDLSLDAGRIRKLFKEVGIPDNALSTYLNIFDVEVSRLQKLATKV